MFDRLYSWHIVYLLDLNLNVHAFESLSYVLNVANESIHSLSTCESWCSLRCLYCFTSPFRNSLRGCVIAQLLPREYLYSRSSSLFPRSLSTTFTKSSYLTSATLQIIFKLKATPLYPHHPTKTPPKHPQPCPTATTNTRTPTATPTTMATTTTTTPMTSPPRCKTSSTNNSTSGTHHPIPLSLLPAPRTTNPPPQQTPHPQRRRLQLRPRNLPKDMGAAPGPRARAEKQCRRATPHARAVCRSGQATFHFD